MNKRKYVYLDYAATTPMDPRVIEEINYHVKHTYGNASSLHMKGQEARKVLADSREKIASVIKAKPEDIIFTSSGTESNNIAILGIAIKLKKQGKHIITSSIEHHAIENPCKELEKHGFKVTYLPVNKFGEVNLEELKTHINDETILITIMFANNEIGTIQPIKEIGEIAQEKNILFHTDAVQAFGKIPIDVYELNIDLLSASSHKIYGPKGVGMLFLKNKGLKRGIGKILKPIMYGGGHERGIRPSTENIPGITGFAKAAELANEEMFQEIERDVRIRDKTIKNVLNNIDDCFLNGHPSKRLPNNMNFGFKYIEGESILLKLDMEGIGVSTGSACSSKSLEPSHVLKAIGMNPEDIHGSLRASIGRFTTEDEIDYFLEKLPKIIQDLRKMSPLGKS